MWSIVQPEILETYSANAQGLSPNGHHDASRVSDWQRDGAAELTSAPVGASRARGWTRQAASMARVAAIAAFAGFVTGFVTLGAGSRIAMRVAAILSADELQGAITTNQERVGEITLSGTWTLLLTGGFFGLGLGLAFAMIRPFLPESGWRRAAASGAVFFAICGFATLEGGHNRDYERFGIAGLNVCLFTLLPLLFGVMIVPLFDWLERRVDSQLPRFSRSFRTLLASAAVVFGLLLAIPGMMVLIFVPPLQLFIAVPLLVWLSGQVGNRFAGSSSSTVVTTWLSRAALAAPCIAGLVMTAIAVGRIM
jgi:hypothetical protein